jgi:hypothetical protein
VSTSGTSSGGSFQAALPGEDFLENQAFVLADVARGFASDVLHSYLPSAAKADSKIACQR